VALGPGTGRERTCPTCDLTVRGRSARWCGACGAPLGTLSVEVSRPNGPPPWLRPILIGVAGACAIAVVVVTGGGLVERAGAPSGSVQDPTVTPPDAAVLDELERRPPPPVPLVEAPTCTRTVASACFLWTAETHDPGLAAVAVADGMLVIADASVGSVEARDLDDGAVVWSVDDGTGFVGGKLLVADDLLLHAAAEGMVGRDLATGVERWRSADDGLGRFIADRARRSGDVLITAGEVRDRATGEHVGVGRAAAARIDPATGALLWMREGLSVSLAAGGATVLTTAEGALQVYGPDGDLRWENEERLSRLRGGSAWARGHVVIRFSGEQRSQLYLLQDGTPLGLDGHVVGSDDEHSLVQFHGDGPDAFALLDADGEVWRTGLGDAPGCVDGTDLGRSTVDVTFCDGSSVSLDRADGSLLGRTEGQRTERIMVTSDGSADRVGPYEFRPVRDADGQLSGATVSDVRTGVDVALVPPETWPVWDETRSSPDLGGALVLQGRGWLLALDLPTGGDEARPAPRRGNVAEPGRR
jgi:outer membrane protein assembly factor BamB